MLTPSVVALVSATSVGAAAEEVRVAAPERRPQSVQVAPVLGARAAVLGLEADLCLSGGGGPCRDGPVGARRSGIETVGRPGTPRESSAASVGVSATRGACCSSSVVISSSDGSADLDAVSHLELAGHHALAVDPAAVAGSHVDEGDRPRRRSHDPGVTPGESGIVAERAVTGRRAADQELVAKGNDEAGECGRSP